jgi:3'(2'), 5'-bisphosphate nucleotidase
MNTFDFVIGAAFSGVGFQRRWGVAQRAPRTPAVPSVDVGISFQTLLTPVGAVTLGAMLELSRSLLDTLAALAQEAGRAMMAVYAKADVGLMFKADQSPLTEADLAADRIIRSGLAQHFPGLPVVTEESPGQRDQDRSPGYFLVDPLDGTREFLARNGEFTVNIAWVVAGRAKAGVVHAPALGETFAGAHGVGAFCSSADQPLRAISCVAPAVRWRVLASRSHGNAALAAWLARLSAATDFAAAGSSLKFCRLAQGHADVYPRFSPTCHWDTAAGQAVLEAAGGAVLQADAQPLRYPATGPVLNPSFVALGDVRLWPQLPPFEA